MRRSVCILTCLLFCLVAGTAHAASWQKFVAKDNVYSFHYPKGWKVDEQKSVVEINNPVNEEQILIISLSDDAKGTPREIADSTLETLKQGYPDLKADNFKDDENTSVFQVSFTDKGKPNQGDVLVLKSDKVAFWFSFAARPEGYSRQRALNILQGVVSSLSGGTGSTPPSDDLLTAQSPAPKTPAPVKLTEADKARLTKDAGAFVFLLEFGLGTPFTASQEKVIIDEMKAGWSSLTAEDVAMQDSAPGLVEQIMKVDQQHMETLRQNLAASMREWLDSSDQSDPAIKVVKNQLNASSKMLVDGDPPLSEIAATAYAEMMTYANLVKKNPNAKPDQISESEVAAYKAKIAKAWNALDADGKNDALSMPGMWMTMRQVLRSGKPEDQKTIRSSMAKVGASSSSSSSGNSSKSSGSKGSSSTKRELARNFIKHNLMMQMKQQTFNTYMWSHNYSGWTPMGKMW